MMTEAAISTDMGKSPRAFTFSETYATLIFYDDQHFMSRTFMILLLKLTILNHLRMFILLQPGH